MKKRVMTQAQRDWKNHQQRLKRKRERKHRIVGLNKELKRPETCGVSQADSDWHKQLYNLSSTISKACIAFFKRRGIPYEYKRDEWSKAK